MRPEDTAKKCSKCGEVKPLGEYWKRRDAADGLCHQCKDCSRARTTAWAKANPKRLRAREARYRDRNREKIRQNYRDWLIRNPGRDRVHSNAWNKRNPKKVRAWVDRRRSRLRSAYVADVDHDLVLVRDLGICGICGEPVMGELHFDHIVPLAAGGTHEPDNVQLAHAACNLRKWTNA